MTKLIDALPEKQAILLENLGYYLTEQEEAWIDAGGFRTIPGYSQCLECGKEFSHPIDGQFYAFCAPCCNDIRTAHHALDDDLPF